MSYTLAPSLGALVAHGATGCETGIEESEAGFCCPDSDWWNSVYAAIKGAESKRYHDEQRVRHALSLMTPEALEQERWKAEGALGQPVRIATGFASRMRTAAARFDALYPIGRWSKIPDAVKTWSHCSPYNVWRSSAPDRSPTWQAAWNAVYAGIPAEHKGPLAQWTWDIGLGPITTVPGSKPTDRRGAVPTKAELFAVVGGALSPIGWTKEFLDWFAPVPAGVAELARARMLLAAPPSPAREAITAAVTRREAVVAQQPQPPQLPWLWLGAAVLCAGLGGGYLWYRRARG